MDRERRRAERYDARLFAKIRNLATQEDLGRGVVLDVSLSGFGLETEADLEQMQDYQFDIEVPLTFRAKVMRRITPGQVKKYGVKLVGQSLLTKIILRKLLKGSRQTIKF
jgi:hypothetical protein